MTIIDVRSKQEFENDHVEGAMWFDVERLAAGEMPDVPKDEEVVLYCRSGARSNVAMHLMQHNGFTHVSSGGGLTQMAMQGHTIVR
jgi:phage shock protein E